MVQPRPQQFGGTPRFTGVPSASGHPISNAVPSSAASPSTARARQLGLGVGYGMGLGSKGLGKGKAFRRHKKIPRDTIRGVTKGDIRRLARRGGVKRISGMIYEDVRQVLKSRLEIILKDIVAIVEHSGRKTVSIQDVIFTLNRLGRPLYGFEPSMRMLS
ncbi:histone-fold-containing protein [Lindgomyces ingoldianus]|uniref:Histone-fold-containing protein n=1 Tax=Lindgomyces ingoldianus TaxID=673940 RepID=A0ACB6R486_9PLEO|nr:histone-fold-containing protein [Lindgomyces ingoldianus]KAF2473910.1 histone-fold-containing protein [Lindgomyces ingoldianus]